MRKGHSLSAVPAYLFDTNTRSLSSSCISPPCPPFAISKVSGWSWAGRTFFFFWSWTLTKAAWFGCTRLFPPLHIYLNCIYNGTCEHALYKGKGRWDAWREEMSNFICSFLTWPLHNFFFICRLTVLLYRTEETVHPSCHTHTELIWRHLQPICRSFTKGTTLCWTNANWMW